jgi:hypothetical protein
MSNSIFGNVVRSGVTVFCQPVPPQGSDGQGFVRQTTSLLNGNYSFSGLSSGTYRITAFLSGFAFSSRIVTIFPAFNTDGLQNVVVIPADAVDINLSAVTLSGSAPGAQPVGTQLGLAGSYALLGGGGITNTGATLITGGNIGSYPTPTETGFTAANFTPPATTDNTNAPAAQVAALAVYNTYSAMPYTSLSSSSANLATLGNGSTASTYTPGNYSAGSSMDIPTSITLDARGNPNAQFVFKAGSTLVLESGASVLLVNGASAANVVWIVGSSFTSVFNGTSSVMNGNILANTSITLGGGTLNGRAIAGIVTTSGVITIAAAENVTVQN